MTTDGELWHVVEAKRDDGMPTMFNIRELEPRMQLTKIFVVELPYPKTTPACLPNAFDYRRHAELEEQWLRPACSTLGWELVGSKVEDGSFFFYMYGASDPKGMIEKLSPFDAALGFYDDDDPDWQEYGTLKELLDQAKAIPATEPVSHLNAPVPLDGTPSATPTMTTTRAKTKAEAKARPKAKAKPKPKAKPKVKARGAKPKLRSASSRKPTSAKPKAAKRKRR